MKQRKIIYYKCMSLYGFCVANKASVFICHFDKENNLFRGKKFSMNDVPFLITNISRKFKFKCDNCDTEYEMSCSQIYNFVKRFENEEIYCPVCGGLHSLFANPKYNSVRALADRGLIDITIADDLDRANNLDDFGNKLTSNDICYTFRIDKSKKYVFKCKYPFHPEFVQSLRERIERNSNCPKCSKVWKTSYAECYLFIGLKQIDKNAIHNYKIENFHFETSRKSLEVDILLHVGNDIVGINYHGYPWHENDNDKDEVLKREFAYRNWKYIIIRENGNYDKRSTYHMWNLDKTEMICTNSMSNFHCEDVFKSVMIDFFNVNIFQYPKVIDVLKIRGGCLHPAIETCPEVCEFYQIPIEWSTAVSGHSVVEVPCVLNGENTYRKMDVLNSYYKHKMQSKTNREKFIEENCAWNKDRDACIDLGVDETFAKTHSCGNHDECIFKDGSIGRDFSSVLYNYHLRQNTRKEKENFMLTHSVWVTDNEACIELGIDEFFAKNHTRMSNKDCIFKNGKIGPSLSSVMILYYRKIENKNKKTEFLSNNSLWVKYNEFCIKMNIDETFAKSVTPQSSKNCVFSDGREGYSVFNMIRLYNEKIKRAEKRKEKLKDMCVWNTDNEACVALGIDENFAKGITRGSHESCVYSDGKIGAPINSVICGYYKKQENAKKYLLYLEKNSVWALYRDMCIEYNIDETFAKTHVKLSSDPCVFKDGSVGKPLQNIYKCYSQKLKRKIKHEEKLKTKSAWVLDREACIALGIDEEFAKTHTIGCGDYCKYSDGRVSKTSLNVTLSNYHRSQEKKIRKNNA